MRPLNLLYFLVICSVVSWGQSLSPSNQDTQAWSEIYVAKKLNERVSALGFGEIHIGRNVSAPLEEQAGVGIAYSPNSFVALVPFYRWVAAEPRPDHHTQESRPQLDVIFHVPLPHRFVINDRNRGEFRWIDGKASQRYAHRMQLERSMLFVHKRLTPFAGVEWFYDTRFSVWNRTRYTAGMRLPVIPHLEVAPYYVRQNDSRAVPGHVNAIAMIVRVEY